MGQDAGVIPLCRRYEPPTPHLFSPTKVLEFTDSSVTHL